MASDQQFCLRWNNHQSTLVSVFDNLLESQTLVDCTLAADGQYLKAHKVVLSACSPYLEAILCQNLDKHPILILKDVKFSELKAMLDYMYRGEVNISQEQLSTFLKAAESLQIKGLTDSGGGGGGGGGGSDRDLLKRQDLRKPLNQPVPHIPQPRPVVPHPGLLEPRRSLPHFPPHIADMQPQSPRHAREGSTSPTARKRRRPNRPSSDDSNFVSTPNSLSENQPDTSDSCDIPVKQSAPSTPSIVPNLTTKAPETDSPRTTPQPQTNNTDQKQQITVKKEFPEALLTPKTEFDYGNDNSMEDVNYEDDEDEEVDLSKPGTSFAGANSQGFPPWQMGGDASNDDSNNMYSPDVTAAATQNNSQGILENFQEITWSVYSKNDDLHNKKNQISTFQSALNQPNERKAIQSPRQSRIIGLDCQTPNRQLRTEQNKMSDSVGKRINCSKCNEYIHIKSIRLHSKYYCGIQPNETEWKICGSRAICLKCKTRQEPDNIEFHVSYICGKNPIAVQCFYCPQIVKHYHGLLKHMSAKHKKMHRVLDLMYILPPPDPLSHDLPIKVVRNFLSNALAVEQEACVNDSSACLQVRTKTTFTCQFCGKELLGIHALENHINTKCESVHDYSCFFCYFKAEFAFEAVEHMAEFHGQPFNTFDLIQAQLTGITPIVDSSTEDVEIDFANRQLYQPYDNMSAIFTQHDEHSEQERRFSLRKRTEKESGENLVQNGESVQNLNFKNMFSLNVSQERVNISKLTTTNKAIPKKIIRPSEECVKCGAMLFSKEVRIHKKYNCGKDPLTKEWAVKNCKATCLRCRRCVDMPMIDFHVKFLCKKYQFAVQCFYCDFVLDNYRSLLSHMLQGHNKHHYYQDLMTILPVAVSYSKDSTSNDQTPGTSTSLLSTVKHPFIFSPPRNSTMKPSTLKFPSSGDDQYLCFYCDFGSKACYVVLDHMEFNHKKDHNLYDLLKVKMKNSKFC